MSEMYKWTNKNTKVNIPHEQIYDNIRTNIRRQLPQLRPYPEQDKHIAIIAGGWSMNDPDVYEEMRQLYFTGMPFIGLNNSPKWLMERNLKPKIHILMDGRPENIEFVKEEIPGTKYYVASQCAPEMFDALEGRDVTIFHAVCGRGDETIPENDEDPEEEDQTYDILNEWYVNRWTPVPSATTVGLVSIMLMRSLGFRFIHLFGLDSCYKPGDLAHHAYSQTLNEGEKYGQFVCADKEFTCSGWQAAQGISFMKMLKEYKDHINLSVHGEGLLKHILRSGAANLEKKE